MGWEAVAAAAEAAAKLLDAGEIEAAAEAIDRAFEALPPEPKGVTFAFLLVIGGTCALEGGDPDSGASLFQRAADETEALEAGQTQPSDASKLRARAWLGLARCDVERGEDERAIERYDTAIRLFRALEHAEPAHLRPPPGAIDAVLSERAQLLG